MTIPPPPPVPAARTASPPRRDNGHPTDPAAREFHGLVREHLQSEQARARTEAADSAPAGPDQGPGADTASGAATTASAATTALLAMPGTLAGLTVAQPIDQQGPELVTAPSLDGLASGQDPTGPAGLSSGASPAAVDVAAASTAANGSPAGPSMTGPDGPTAGSVAGPGSPPASGPSDPATPSHLSADLGPASESASSSGPASTVDVAAARDDAGGSPVRLDATGAAVPVAPSATPAGPTASTGSTSPAGPVLDQALPVVNRLVSRGDGTHRMTLKLYPVELGEIQLTVTVRGDRVDVTFAAGAQAREALREGAGQLRGLLELTGRTTGHLLVRDLPGVGQATPPQQPATGTGSAPAGTPLGDTGTGGGQWQEQGHDSAGPGGSRTHGDSGQAGRTSTVLAPTAAPTPTVSPATALDVRL